MKMEQKGPAGLEIRFCAGLIDLALVAAVVVLAAETVAGWGLYVPMEVTVLALYAVYTAMGVAWKGQTLGKAALGVRVTGRDGGNVGWGPAAGRAILVGLSQLSLGLPLLVIGLGSSKRGWHDRLAGTVVICREGLGRRRRIASAAVMSVVGIYLAYTAFDTFRLYRLHRAWIGGANVAAARTYDAGIRRIEAASVDTAERQRMAAWLQEHGSDPAEALIDLTATHQVTIVGEFHGRKANLDFLNQMLPDLYDKAGVRTLALECCHPRQDKDLNRLVQGPEFDRGLLLTLARGYAWRMWGHRGYWDALETVWRVNRALPSGSEPLRVVGISPGYDLPSVFLVRKGPWYEKLRIVRLVRTARLMAFHDAHYARCVEREAFDHGRRTLVWVGASHASLRPFWEMPGRHGTVYRSHRMGSMLFGRYGTAVGQAVLHSALKEERVGKLIEECAQQCSKTRTAFATAESPFALLRAAGDFTYDFRPARSLADYASHYIMLAPQAQLQDCDWLEGFLSPRMLGENRPFYELLADGPIDDLGDGDRRLAKGFHRL